jgi:hypothetical protein
MMNFRVWTRAPEKLRMVEESSTIGDGAELFLRAVRNQALASVESAGLPPVPWAPSRPLHSGSGVGSASREMMPT